MANETLTHFDPFELVIPNATRVDGTLFANLSSVIDGDIAADTLTLTGDAEVGGTLEVTGATTCAALTSSTTIQAADLVSTDDVTVGDDLVVVGAATIGETLGVTGASTMAALTCTTLAASGNFSVATNRFTVASASGNTVIAGTLGVTGVLTTTTDISCGGSVGATSVVTNTITAFAMSTLAGGLTLTVPTYADNAAALLGGLVATNVYQTATGELRIVV